MSLKQQIEQDIKTALLAGDKPKVDTLRGLKSTILNEEVAKGLRDKGLSDEEITNVLAKESKKRQESVDLYIKGQRQDRADAELKEKAIIDSYLPEQLSETKLSSIINEVIEKNGSTGMESMGKVIGAVKQQVGASGDGAVIAKLVKERLSKT